MAKTLKHPTGPDFKARVPWQQNACEHRAALASVPFLSSALYAQIEERNRPFESFLLTKIQVVCHDPSRLSKQDNESPTHFSDLSTWAPWQPFLLPLKEMCQLPLSSPANHPGATSSASPSPVPQPDVSAGVRGTSHLHLWWIPKEVEWNTAGFE